LKQPRRLSHRQLMLPLERETPIRLGEEAREDLIRTLADLLLEAIGTRIGQPTEGGRKTNESQD
jgi:hypothetical protein